ncbi:MAG: hypothetical protein M1825_006082 [Sarcosagium campestre]|nr:MAG: hypothetical protein M1825_006082 [Sarcosagium campestre]
MIENLPAMVEKKFVQAKSSGSLIFSITDLAIIRALGLPPFQLRYCPALAFKPEPRKKPDNVKGNNPFEVPDPNLLIAEIPYSKPSHSLILNKYPVIPNHFLLVTKTFREQNSLLEREDLDASFACLKSWNMRGGKGKLFAFFNSGEHSGASQKHRHIQFLPVEEMANVGGGAGWQLLADILPVAAGAPRRNSPPFPFLYFRRVFSAEPDPLEIYDAYIALYKEAVTADAKIKGHGIEEANIIQDAEDQPSAISYNLALTTDSMTLCPRRSGGAMISATTGGSEQALLGPVELNGTVLAGTLMVKTEDEWNTLRKEPAKLTELLRSVCVPIESGPTHRNENYDTRL